MIRTWAAVSLLTALAALVATGAAIWLTGSVAVAGITSGEDLAITIDSQLLGVGALGVIPQLILLGLMLMAVARVSEGVSRDELNRSRDGLRSLFKLSLAACGLSVVWVLLRPLVAHRLPIAYPLLLVGLPIVLAAIAVALYVLSMLSRSLRPPAPPEPLI